MADFGDNARKINELFSEFVIGEARNEAARIPKGVPGTCARCGEESLRLVRGACAPCRDKFKLP